MTGRGRAIVLIGFMGSGKSATGRALARKTGWALSDTDEIVTARFGKAIAEIFAEFGEEKFRDAETEAIRQLSGVAPRIVETHFQRPRSRQQRHSNLTTCLRKPIIHWLSSNSDTTGIGRGLNASTNALSI